MSFFVIGMASIVWRKSIDAISAIRDFAINTAVLAALKLVV